MTKKAKSRRQKLSINRASLRKLTDTEGAGAAGGLPFMRGTSAGGCTTVPVTYYCATGNTCDCPASAGCAG